MEQWYGRYIVAASYVAHAHDPLVVKSFRICCITRTLLQLVRHFMLNFSAADASKTKATIMLISEWLQLFELQASVTVPAIKGQ